MTNARFLHETDLIPTNKIPAKQILFPNKLPSGYCVPTQTRCDCCDGIADKLVILSFLDIERSCMLCSECFHAGPDWVAHKLAEYFIQRHQRRELLRHFAP